MYSHRRQNLIGEEGGLGELARRRLLRMLMLATALAVALLLIGTLVSPATVYGQAADANLKRTPDMRDRECSQASLKGPYGYFFTGSAVDVGPVAAVGLATFYGGDAVVVRDTLNMNGHISRRNGTGYYQVNSNCTGSVAVTGDFGDFTFDFMIIPDSSGTEFSLIVTNSGAIQTGEAIHVGEEACTLATLHGTYRQSGSTPPGPRSASVGFRIADGAGTFYGEDTQSINGVIGHRIVMAAYTVNADCTVSISASVGEFDGVLVDRGNQSFGLRADPGFISLGLLKREERRRGR